LSPVRRAAWAALFFGTAPLLGAVGCAPESMPGGAPPPSTLRTDAASAPPSEGATAPALGAGSAAGSQPAEPLATEPLATEPPTAKPVVGVGPRIRPPRPLKPGTAPPSVAVGPPVPLGLPDFATVFKLLSPSVVAVVAGHRDAKGTFVPKRTGTGFAWDAQGHCITNHHLINGAAEVRVRAEDGRVKAVTVVAADAATDIAVLKVEGLDLPPVVRSAETAQPGQWVAGLGNPYGLQHSISVGVVSAVGRTDLPGEAPRDADFIQTDLNLNPGSSGGPLVDGLGRVLGMNTAVLGNAQGVSFATPIGMVETVVGRLLRDGKFVRGFGGMVVRAVSPTWAQKAGLDRPNGARVHALVKGGPAQLAGLEPGDIILKFGTTEVQNEARLPWLIARSEAGTTVPLEVARGPARLRVRLTVTASP
jgi:S1-C subfamily serine protease